MFASTEMFNRPFAGAEVNDRNGQAKDPDQSMHVVREGEPTDLTVFVRGNVQTPGVQTHRGFLTVLSRGEPLQFESGKWTVGTGRGVGQPSESADGSGLCQPYLGVN